MTKADPEELASDQQVHVAPIADLRHLDFVQILVRTVAAPAASGRR